MSLTRGERYTRNEVHRRVGGGNPVGYLLSVQQRIVAACLDPKKNPDAPRVILVGNGRDVQKYGAQLAGQDGAVHVFLKEEGGPRDNEGHPQNWLYWGRYASHQSFTDSKKIAPYAARARRSNVTRVIILKPAVSDDSLLVEQFTEGASRQITADRRERSPEARQACIRIHGYRCAACNILFSELYGEIGRDFIHVHHREQMSTKIGAHTVDPRDDLIPVCPNCHAMLHRRSPLPYTIDELRSMLEGKIPRILTAIPQVSGKTS